jgi:hypothetical protein
MNPYKSRIGETNQCRFCGAGLGSQPHAEHYAQCSTNAPALSPVQCPECDHRLSECDGHRCSGRCGRPDQEHGRRPKDSQGDMDRLSELGTARGFARMDVERAKCELERAEAEYAVRDLAYQRYIGETAEGANNAEH